jgi:hypothetical protein
MTPRRRPAPSLRAGLALAIALGTAQPLNAQQPAPAPAAAPTPATPPGDTVVARVDGEPITLGDLNAAARELPEELRGTPPQVLFPLLLDQVIAGRAVTAAARRAGLDRDEAVRARIRRAEEQELQQAWLSGEIASRVSEAAVRARYDQQIAGRPAEEEVHARHILVPTESEAPWPRSAAGRTSPRWRGAARPAPVRAKAATSASSGAATWCRNSPPPPSPCNPARSARTPSNRPSAGM